MSKIADATEAVLVLCPNGTLHPCHGAAIELGEGWPFQLKKKYTGGMIATESACFRI